MTAQQTEGVYLLRFIMSEFISLYSGSSGNSSVVRCGERYLIVDMGKGVRTTGAALKELELNISDCDGILVTHEHSDHVKGLSAFLKKYPLPVYGAEETLEFLDANGVVPATCDLTALTPGRINGEPCTALQGSMIPAVERIGVGGNSLCLECFVRPADRHFGGDSPQNVFPAGKLHYLSGGLILHRKGLGVCGRKVFWLRCGQLRHRRCCGQRRCMAQHSPRDPVGGQRQSTAQNQQDCKDQQK